MIHSAVNSNDPVRLVFASTMAGCSAAAKTSERKPAYETVNCQKESIGLRTFKIHVLSDRGKGD